MFEEEGGENGNVSTEELPLDSESGNLPAGDGNNPPAASAIDFASLYRETRLEAQRLLEENARLVENARRAATPPQPPAEDFTDADLERMGSARYIQEVIRRELQASNGDMRQFSEAFKKNQQINEAEEAFYRVNAFPPAAREKLAPIVRQALANVQNVDFDTYTEKTMAAIGRFALFSENASASPSAPTVNNPPVTPPAAPAPARNGRAPGNVSAPTRMLETERKEMRKYGLDPDKQEDVVQWGRLTADGEFVV